MSWRWWSLIDRQGMTIRSVGAERLRLFRLLSAGHGSTAAMATGQLLGCLGPAATALAAGFAVQRTEEAVSDRDPSIAIPGLVVLGVVFLVTQALDTMTEGLSTNVRLRIDGWVRQRARTAANSRPTLVELGDPGFQEDVTRAVDLGQQSGRVRSPGSAAVGQAHLCARLVGGMLVAVVLARFSIVVAVAVVVLALTNRAVLRRQWMHLANVEDGQSRLRRRTDHWSELARDPRAAGEVRLFALGPWITMRHHRVMVAERGPVSRDRMTVMRQQSLIVVLTVVAAVVGILPPALAASSGTITAAQLVTYMTATWGVLSLAGMGHEAFDIEYGRSTVRALDRLLALTNQPEPVSRPPAHDGLLVELEQVTFAYPGQPWNVLQQCNLKIRTGEVLGLVGLNGAGKTTLVKMIAGLLDPTGGTVRGGNAGSVDGAAVFQNVVHYPLSLRDNVAMAAPEASATDAAVSDALRLAGLEHIVARLPHGLDTVLHRDLVGGATFPGDSGSGWQLRGRCSRFTQAASSSSWTSRLPISMSGRRPGSTRPSCAPCRMPRWC